MSGGGAAAAQAAEAAAAPTLGRGRRCNQPGGAAKRLGARGACRRREWPLCGRCARCRRLQRSLDCSETASWGRLARAALQAAPHAWRPLDGPPQRLPSAVQSWMMSPGARRTERRRAEEAMPESWTSLGCGHAHEAGPAPAPGQLARCRPCRSDPSRGAGRRVPWPRRRQWDNPSSPPPLRRPASSLQPAGQQKLAVPKQDPSHMGGFNCPAISFCTRNEPSACIRVPRRPLPLLLGAW